MVSSVVVNTGKEIPRMMKSFYRLLPRRSSEVWRKFRSVAVIMNYMIMDGMDLPTEGIRTNLKKAGRCARGEAKVPMEVQTLDDVTFSN